VPGTAPLGPAALHGADQGVGGLAQGAVGGVERREGLEQRGHRLLSLGPLRPVADRVQGLLDLGRVPLRRQEAIELRLHGSAVRRREVGGQGVEPVGRRAGVLPGPVAPARLQGGRGLRYRALDIAGRVGLDRAAERLAERTILLGGIRPEP
jgi:hypothetical protein